jgi:uncharacterized protein YndB with AHSA1/START domain
MEPRTKASVWVKAPPEKVFTYVGDLTKHGEWAKAPLKVHGEGQPGKGARYTSESVFLGKPVHAELHVTKYDPPTGIAFDAVHKDGAYKHEFVLRAQNGGTSVERHIVLPPTNPVKGLMLQLFIAPTAVRSEAKKALGTLKQIVER